MRFLGVDLGTKRIGIAVGEDRPVVVSPRPALAASGKLSRDAEAVVQLARREEVQAIVVGVPLEDGQETRMSRVCRQFGDLLASSKLPVHYVDETLSSVEAEQMLLQADLKASQRRRLRDGEAACRILERFIENSVA